jgi:hypothetical protein
MRILRITQEKSGWNWGGRGAKLGWASACDGCSEAFRKGETINVVRGQDRASGELIFCDACFKEAFGSFIQ